MANSVIIHILLLATDLSVFNTIVFLSFPNRFQILHVNFFGTTDTDYSYQFLYSAVSSLFSFKIRIKIWKIYTPFLIYFENMQYILLNFIWFKNWKVKLQQVLHTDLFWTKLNRQSNTDRFHCKHFKL